MGVSGGVFGAAGKGVSLGFTVKVWGKGLGVFACSGSMTSVVHPAIRDTITNNMIVLIN